MWVEASLIKAVVRRTLRQGRTSAGPDVRPPLRPGSAAVGNPFLVLNVLADLLGYAAIGLLASCFQPRDARPASDRCLVLVSRLSIIIASLTPYIERLVNCPA
jgi:hypothetical protein